MQQLLKLSHRLHASVKTGSRHRGSNLSQFRLAASSNASRPVMGPEPPPSRASRSKPDWVRILEEDAVVDEDVAELLEGTNSDPEKIRAKMQQKLSEPPRLRPSEAPFQAPTGSETPPRITFREVDVFDMWVWIEMLVPPSEREKELLQSTVRSWFVVGKLGGFNSGNMQVYYNNSDDNSFMDYDNSELDSSYRSYMHECSEVEFKGSWARFHLDMGTADELAFDVLLNMLVGFSSEVAGMSQVIVGGQHERWEVPAAGDDDEFEGTRTATGHGEAPKVGMNPMKLPSGLEEELEMLDELGAIYEAERLQQSPGFSNKQGLRPVNPNQPVQPSQAGSRNPGRLRQQQQQQSMQGMTTYSPDEFRRAFNVRDDEDD